MAEERFQTSKGYMDEFRSMTLDDVADQAAGNPGTIKSSIAEVEIRRRVAEAQIAAAKAQQEATPFLKYTAVGTVALAIATFVLAIATFVHG